MYNVRCLIYTSCPLTIYRYGLRLIDKEEYFRKISSSYRNFPLLWSCPSLTFSCLIQSDNRYWKALRIRCSESWHGVRKISWYSRTRALPDPIHDLIWDLAEVRALEAYGMRLLLIGNDVLALQQRLQHHNRKYGQNRKSHIYLVGHCPVMTRTNEIRDRLINTSLFGAPSAHSIFVGTMEIRWMKAKVTLNDLSAETIFIMSFGASTQANERQGF